MCEVGSKGDQFSLGWIYFERRKTTIVYHNLMKEERETGRDSTNFPIETDFFL